MKVRFAEKNAFGVLDHYVTPAPELDVYVPMRVLPNGSGNEVISLYFGCLICRMSSLPNVAMVERN